MRALTAHMSRALLTGRLSLSLKELPSEVAALNCRKRTVLLLVHHAMFTTLHTKKLTMLKFMAITEIPSQLSSLIVRI